MIESTLEARGLARPSEDGASIPLHPSVWTTILVILGQLSRVTGARKGLSVHPATNDADAIAGLMRRLSREPLPSADRVITLDLEAVSFDLTLVPLDDILEFREEHHRIHRACVRDLHGFMAELAAIDDSNERERMLTERRQEISDPAKSFSALRFAGSATAWMGRPSRLGWPVPLGRSAEDSILSVSSSPPRVWHLRSSPAARPRSLPTRTSSPWTESSVTADRVRVWTTRERAPSVASAHAVTNSDGACFWEVSPPHSGKSPARESAGSVVDLHKRQPAKSPPVDNVLACAATGARNRGCERRRTTKRRL